MAGGTLPKPMSQTADLSVYQVSFRMHKKEFHPQILIRQFVPCIKSLKLNAKNKNQ